MKHEINSRASVNKHPEWTKKTKETNALKQEKEERKIVVKNAIVSTNLRLKNKNYQVIKQQKPEDFDWTPYEDGWNGKSLRSNKRIKLTNKFDKVFCHETYAQDVYNMFMLTYNEIAKTRSYATDVRSSLLYLFAFLKFKRIPSVEFMESD